MAALTMIVVLETVTDPESSGAEETLIPTKGNGLSTNGFRQNAGRNCDGDRVSWMHRSACEGIQCGLAWPLRRGLGAELRVGSAADVRGALPADSQYTAISFDPLQTL